MSNRTHMDAHAPGLAIALDWMAPEQAFLCFAEDDFTVFLHSAGPAGTRSRYSYLGVDPFRVLRDVSLHALQADMAKWHIVWPDAPTPFAGGAMGFLGYDMGARLERVPRAPGAFTGVPDMQFGLFDLVFAWDHAEHRSWLLCAWPRAEERAAAALKRLRDGATRRATPRLTWKAGISRAGHMARVAQALRYIQAGDIYQANITAPFFAERLDDVRPADMFLALAAANPAPFTAYIGCGQGCAVASVSPERFIRLDGDGGIETRPIKGTRPRGVTPEQDAAEAAALLASAKDRAENLMIVDLLRNDISRVAVPGSVRVPALHVLESFASVHHLVSVVEGQMRPGLDAVDLLRATFPGGSITGAPKIRAMEIIAELEGQARGPYCGAAAWLGFDGAMDSSILIRTVTIAADRIVAQAGGGIVADSDPASEWDEVMVKLLPMLRALGDL
jgi:para-aminobenzoate synthetase component 1